MRTLTYTDTPVDYTNASMTGRIDVTVEEDENNADLIVSDADGTVALRLDRTELAALIASAARALAALSY